MTCHACVRLSFFLYKIFPVVCDLLMSRASAGAASQGQLCPSIYVKLSWPSCQGLGLVLLLCENNYFFFKKEDGGEEKRKRGGIGTGHMGSTRG